MIHHTCFKCKRRFELDPVFVGFELSKLKKKNPSHYQAVCPACRSINKVSVEQMQADLDQVADEIQQMIADYEAQKAAAKTEKKAKTKTGKKADTKSPKSRSRKRLKA
ncbi:MAG: hypothetical protein JXM69_03265 [Anaerolineae bacterium]|nr:hypothetical protein [Anaerolineae bacterium]